MPINDQCALKRFIAAKIASFEYVVGSQQEFVANGETERLNYFKSHYQLKFRWCLHWQLGRVRARPIADETALAWRVIAVTSYWTIKR